MGYVDFGADVLWHGASAAIAFEGLSYLEEGRDYLETDPEDLPDLTTFKSAYESEPQEIYKSPLSEEKEDYVCMKEREIPQDLSEEGLEEEAGPAKWEDERMPETGSFLADETIITHGSG